MASSRAEARGLERAERAGVESAVFALADQPDRALRDEALGDWLEERGVELVVLAGFMELLTPEFIRRFRGRIVNVHPALLPAFPGLGAIEQAVEHGVKVTGVTVHFVDEGVDSGPIVLQEAFALPYPRGHRGDRAALPRGRAPPAAARGAADRRRCGARGRAQSAARARRFRERTRTRGGWLKPSRAARTPRDRER